MLSLTLRFWMPLLSAAIVTSACPAREPVQRVEDVSFKADCDGSPQNYVVIYPKSFDKQKPQTLLVALHGHGSDRWQFVKQPRGECRAARDVAAEHGLLIVSPDYRAKTSWMGPKAEADVAQIIRSIKKQMKVDRVVVCGGSMGGTGALTFAALHPELVDGVVSLNGTANLVEYEKFSDAIARSFGGTRKEVPEEYRRRSAEFFPERFKMPIAATTGGKDRTVPPDSVLRLLAVVRKKNGNVLSLHRKDGGHSTNYEDSKAALEFVIARSAVASAQTTGQTGLARTAEFILSCRKPNGAFGPRDQDYTDAAWNYPAVHALKLLGAEIPEPEAVLQNGLGYPSGHAGYGHWLVYHQAMTRWLLTSRGQPEATLPPDVKRAPVTLTHQGFEVRYYGSPFGTGGDDFFKTDGPSTNLRFQNLNEAGFYNLSSLHFLVAAVLADGREIANRELLINFIRDRQAPNGGFVDVRSANGEASDQDAHLSHTFHAVTALTLLGSEIPRRELCAKFAKSCQLLSIQDQPQGSPEREIGAGGFRFSPDPTRPGNLGDVYYTICGLQILNLLDAEPQSPKQCADWLASLQNHDGGFGDRPGWRFRLYSTYYAVHSLAILNQMRDRNQGRPAGRSELAGIAGQPILRDDSKLFTPQAISASEPARSIDDSSKIFQALFKTPVVEPANLEDLSQRGFNLLAMKSDDFSKTEPLLDFIANKALPIDVVLCPEAYPHRLKRHGSVDLHHVGNFTLDPKWNLKQRREWLKADEAGRDGLPWREYQQRVLKPLQTLGSHCYPEQDYELEFAYSAYDDGVYGRSGYNAVQVGFNWSPRDFVRVFPWRERYVDKLVPVADADSHGDLKKWSPQLDHTRHLYISVGPGYSDYLDAARNGRVVCVVYGVEGVPSGVSYYGPPAAVDFVKRRVDEWKWWPTPPVTD